MVETPGGWITVPVVLFLQQTICTQQQWLRTIQSVQRCPRPQHQLLFQRELYCICNSNSLLLLSHRCKTSCSKLHENSGSRCMCKISRWKIFVTSCTLCDTARRWKKRCTLPYRSCPCNSVANVTPRLHTFEEKTV